MEQNCFPVSNINSDIYKQRQHDLIYVLFTGIDIAITVPLILNNTIIGSVSLEMPFDPITKKLDALMTVPVNSSAKEFDYVFIVDSHGKLFYHPRQQWKINSNSGYKDYTGQRINK